MNPEPDHTLIVPGDHTLHSGKKSFFKLVADQFIIDNLPGLVLLSRHLVGPFSSVEGVPTGGNRLADALKPFALPGSGPALIVDDILTTGASMEAAWNVKHEALGSPAWISPFNYIRGLVVFARGQRPHWVQALFDMPPDFWLNEPTR